ncbi:hypothetical protein B005_2006 [Nocardiopsis alba ATCC BAA-2165]|uniref:Uncharacterized protein n=1 Tax=Nocardiopsis alba (strain ATCC BAA-2165 / BE74) TaxID=1205910 RepID=J7LB33_NOCAA|nr:hypothetical protein B005_2006 [Nocardiopsis alba ATCC BAA-2165]
MWMTHVNHLFTFESIGFGVMCPISQVCREGVEFKVNRR